MREGGRKASVMMGPEAANVTEQEEQLVVFELAGECYGVEIGAVNTIIRMQGITRVPQAPEFVEGMTNLRGSTIPVIDLRQRLGLGAYEESKSSRIVALESSLGLVGLIVDAVTEIRSVSEDAIEPASSLVTAANSHYLRGVAKLEDRLVILLDLERVLRKAENEELGEATTGEAEAEIPSMAGTSV